MVDVGDAFGLVEATDLLKGRATNHHRGGDDEIDLDQRGQDGADRGVVRSAASRRVPETRIDPSDVVDQSRGTVGENDGRILEQRKPSSILVGGHLSSPSRTAKIGLLARASAVA